MREWQLTKLKDYLMPEAVFCQSIWAVRDLQRMEERLTELRENPDDINTSSFYVCSGDKMHTCNSPTERRAVERVNLEGRVNAIRDALSVVPEECREAVLLNVAEQVGFEKEPKIHRIWKQRFLYYVARNLSLM